MSTRGPSRAIDRALFWNGLCVALITAAVGTAFIDVIPLDATLGLCALGLVAGVIGVPLYLVQLFGRRRSPRPAADAGRPSRARSAGDPSEEAAPGEVGGPPEPAPATVDQESRPRCSCHGLPVRE